MELKLVNAVMLGRYLSRGNTVLCSWVFVCKQLLAIQPPSKPVQNNLYQLRYSFFSMLCAVFRNKAFLFLFLFLYIYIYIYIYILYIQIDRGCMSTWVWPGLELCSSVDLGFILSFRCIFSLPPLLLVYDTFLHAVNLGH